MHKLLISPHAVWFLFLTFASFFVVVFLFLFVRQCSFWGGGMVGGGGLSVVSLIHTSISDN